MQTGRSCKNANKFWSLKRDMRGPLGSVRRMVSSPRCLQTGRGLAVDYDTDNYKWKLGCLACVGTFNRRSGGWRNGTLLPSATPPPQPHPGPPSPD